MVHLRSRDRRARRRLAYSPGLGTSLFCFTPAAIYLIANMSALSSMDWLGGVVWFAILMIVCIPAAAIPFGD